MQAGREGAIDRTVQRISGPEISLPAPARMVATSCEFRSTAARVGLQSEPTKILEKSSNDTFQTEAQGGALSISTAMSLSDHVNGKNCPQISCLEKLANIDWLRRGFWTTHACVPQFVNIPLHVHQLPSTFSPPPSRPSLPACASTTTTLPPYSRPPLRPRLTHRIPAMGLFGKKPELVNTPYVAPPRPAAHAGPSMDQAIHNSTIREGNLQARINAIEQDIINYKKEMQRCRPNTATYNMYKRRALQAMKQRKSLENRAAMTANATFNLEQIRDTKYMQQDNVSMAQNLRAANQELRAAQQQIDIDEIEDLHDDVQEALEDANEVQEVLGRSYDVDNIDETELMAELDELEEDSLNYATGEGLSTPSYLQPSAIETTPARPQQPQLSRPNYAEPESMHAHRY